jgi:hypothetical protein
MAASHPSSHAGVPPGNEGFQYLLQFQVEQWSPFAAMSEISDQDSDLSLYSIDKWRPSPFKTGVDMFSNSPVNNIFDGILVDMAVATKGTWMERVSYNITLLGKIVFTQMIITSGRRGQGRAPPSWLSMPGPPEE